MGALQTIYQKRRSNNLQMALCQASSVNMTRNYGERNGAC